MEININDYISEDQKREIAEDMFRQAFAQKLRDSNDVSRILSNISYKVVFQEIDAAVEGGGETLREQIRDRAFEHINKGGNYGIFRSKDHWNDASTATKIVEGFVQEKKDLIEERVHQAIAQMPFDKVKEEITAGGGYSRETWTFTANQARIIALAINASADELEES